MEYRVEREERVVGSIFKGIVQNVLPGMDAAFVDIGLERNAFLYVADIIPDDGSDNSPASMRRSELRRRKIKELINEKELLQTGLRKRKVEASSNPPTSEESVAPPAVAASGTFSFVHIFITAVLCFILGKFLI